jgi:hypothetical protein
MPRTPNLKCKRRGVVVVRPSAIALAFLIGIIGAPRVPLAAQLECLLVIGKDPATHEKFDSKTAPNLPAPPPGFGPVTPLKCAYSLLRGKIIAGDYEKVRQALRDSWPHLTEINLDSPGGSVLEALKIGRLLRKYLITATVSRAEAQHPPSAPGPAPPFDPSKPYTVLPAPSDSWVCASACALIWFGGVERSGTVGLHRPRITDPDFASASPEEATKRYRLLLSAIEAYLTEMEAPRPIIDQMLATGSSEIRWIDAVSEGLSRPPSYAEWEDTSCHDKFEPAVGPLVDGCRGPLRLSRVKLLSPP